MSDKSFSGQYLGGIGKTGEKSCCAPGDPCCSSPGPSENKHDNTMKTVKVFDPPMCCSTGICGPNVDPGLVRFAADLKWLERQGVVVERFNLTQSPKAFVDDALVRSMLSTKGEKALPLVFVDGKAVASGTYPSREELVEFVDLRSVADSLFTPRVAELVAIGAAVAANCDSCLRHHVKVALGMGVSVADIALAVDLAAKVKEVPHRAVLKLAERLTRPETDEETASDASREERIEV